MRGGFRRQVSPASRLRDVDVEGSRAARRELHEQVRLRSHLLQLLASAPFDGDTLEIKAAADTVDEPNRGVA